MILGLHNYNAARDCTHADMRRHTLMSVFHLHGSANGRVAIYSTCKMRCLCFMYCLNVGDGSSEFSSGSTGLMVGSNCILRCRRLSSVLVLQVCLCCGPRACEADNPFLPVPLWCFVQSGMSNCAQTCQDISARQDNADLTMD